MTTSSGLSSSKEVRIATGDYHRTVQTRKMEILTLLELELLGGEQASGAFERLKVDCGNASIAKDSSGQLKDFVQSIYLARFRSAIQASIAKQVLGPLVAPLAQHGDQCSSTSTLSHLLSSAEEFLVGGSPIAVAAADIIDMTSAERQLAVLACGALCLQIHLQANVTGPPFRSTKPSSVINAEPSIDQVPDELDGLIGPLVHDSWPPIFLGHPDAAHTDYYSTTAVSTTAITTGKGTDGGEGDEKDVSASSSSLFASSAEFSCPEWALRLMADDLAADGEILHERVQAVPYLWAAVRIFDLIFRHRPRHPDDDIDQIVNEPSEFIFDPSSATTTSSASSSSLTKKPTIAMGVVVPRTLGLWIARAAFAQQSNLAGSNRALAPSLLEKMLAVPLAALANAQFVGRHLPLIALGKRHHHPHVCDPITALSSPNLACSSSPLSPSSSSSPSEPVDVVQAITTSTSESDAAEACGAAGHGGGPAAYYGKSSRSINLSSYCDKRNKNLRTSEVSPEAAALVEDVVHGGPGRSGQSGESDGDTLNDERNNQDESERISRLATYLFHTTIDPDESTTSSSSSSSSSSLSLSTILTDVLLIETAARLAFAGMTALANELLDVLTRRHQFFFNLTGIPGKRRGMQIHDVPQLVVQVSTPHTAPSNVTTGTAASTGSAPNGTAQADSTGESAEVVEGGCGRGVDVTIHELDPGNDLYERPVLARSEDEQNLSTPLSVNQTSLLLVAANTLFEGAPSNDEMMLHALRAFAERVLVLPRGSSGSVVDIGLSPAKARETKNMLRANSWALYSLGLWYRSKAEHHRPKTVDRAALQLQALVDQFEDELPTAAHRLLSVHSVNFPVRWLMRTEYGMRMMALGAVKTASEMFQKLRMWEEAAECLTVSQSRSEAATLLESRLAIRQTPRLWAAHGDLNDNPESYKKSWKLSNGRFARAQRSLGHHFFRHRQYPACIEAYAVALALNPSHERCWFAKGCAEMRLHELDASLVSFGRVVSINPEAHEAWANMAAVLSKKENWRQAKLCITEAVKRQRENAQLWDTNLKVCVKTSDIAGVVTSLRQLLDLNCPRAEFPSWALDFVVRYLILTTPSEDHGDDVKSRSNPRADSGTINSAAKQEAAEAQKVIHVDGGGDHLAPRDARNTYWKQQAVDLFKSVLWYISDQPALYRLQIELLLHCGMLTEAFQARQSEFRLLQARFSAAEQSATVKPEDEAALATEIAKCAEGATLQLRRLAALARSKATGSIEGQTNTQAAEVSRSAQDFLTNLEVIGRRLAEDLSSSSPHRGTKKSSASSSSETCLLGDSVGRRIAAACEALDAVRQMASSSSSLSSSDCFVNRR